MCTGGEWVSSSWCSPHFLTPSLLCPIEPGGCESPTKSLSLPAGAWAAGLTTLLPGELSGTLSCLSRDPQHSTSSGQEPLCPPGASGAWHSSLPGDKWGSYIQTLAQSAGTKVLLRPCSAG